MIFLDFIPPSPLGAMDKFPFSRVKEGLLRLQFT